MFLNWSRTNLERLLSGDMKRVMSWERDWLYILFSLKIVSRKYNSEMVELYSWIYINLSWVSHLLISSAAQWLSGICTNFERSNRSDLVLTIQLSNVNASYTTRWAYVFCEHKSWSSDWNDTIRVLIYSVWRSSCFLSKTSGLTTQRRTAALYSHQESYTVDR